MIEIICNEENSDKSKQVTRGAAIRRPKNIKQIGEVSSDKKIYIEDYAFTYIIQLLTIIRQTHRREYSWAKIRLMEMKNVFLLRG